MKQYSVWLLVLVCVALIARKALAAQHVVGGNQGWDESTDFNSWSSGQKFKVGDQLGKLISSLFLIYWHKNPFLPLLT